MQSMAKALAALSALLALPLALAAAAPARSASLVISETALQKLIDTRFASGKIPISRQDDCNSSYVEAVHITISGGRVHVAGHLSGRAGRKVPMIGCVASADPSSFSVSGVPAASGSTLRLTSITLDDIEKKELKLPLSLLLRNFAESATQINLKPAAEKALKNTSPYAVTLEILDLQSITAGEKVLTVNFDFKLSVQ
jgi:hypothetical protein